jgi:hypothetical protein
MMIRLLGEQGIEFLTANSNLTEFFAKNLLGIPQNYRLTTMFTTDKRSPRTVPHRTEQRAFRVELASRSFQNHQD